MQTTLEVPVLLTKINRAPVRRSLRKRSLPAAAALLAVLLPAAGCHRGHSADVVATVNGHAIMRKELDKAYAAQISEGQQQVSGDQADSMRLNVLVALINEEIVQQRAAKLNLTATNEEVDAKLGDEGPLHGGAVRPAAEGQPHHAG